MAPSLTFGLFRHLDLDLEFVLDLELDFVKVRGTVLDPRHLDFHHDQLHDAHFRLRLVDLGQQQEVYMYNAFLTDDICKKKNRAPRQGRTKKLKKGGANIDRNEIFL